MYLGKSKILVHLHASKIFWRVLSKNKEQLIMVVISALYDKHLSKDEIKLYPQLNIHNEAMSQRLLVLLP